MGVLRVLVAADQDLEQLTSLPDAHSARSLSVKNERNMLFLLWRYSCSSMLCLESFSDAEAAATFNPCVKEVARRLIEDQSGSQVRGDMQTMGNEVTICSRENENGHRRCADR